MHILFCFVKRFTHFPFFFLLFFFTVVIDTLIKYKDATHCFSPSGDLH